MLLSLMYQTQSVGIRVPIDHVSCLILDQDMHNSFMSIPLVDKIDVIAIHGVEVLTEMRCKVKSIHIAECTCWKVNLEA